MSKMLKITGEVRAKEGAVKPVSLVYEFNDGLSFNTLVGMVNNVPVPDGSRFVITDMQVSDETHGGHETKSLWGQNDDSDNVHYLSEWTKAEVLPLDSSDTDIACRLSSLLDGLEEMNFELFDEEAVKLMYLLMDRYTGRNKERKMK